MDFSIRNSYGFSHRAERGGDLDAGRQRRAVELLLIARWLPSAASGAACTPPRSHLRLFAAFWRRLDGHNHLTKVVLGVKFTDGIEALRSQALAAAA